MILAIPGCVRSDPNHCANREQDATCVELQLGTFCSACEGSNNGCVADQPDDMCHPGSFAAGTSTGVTTSMPATDTAMEDESGSSGPPPACVLEGEADPGCPEANPYCIDGTCGTCDLAADDFCGTLDASTPTCHRAWGRCVECTEVDETACSEQEPFCGLDFSCTGCTSHDQCPDSACDLSRRQCLPTDALIYVDSNSSTCPGSNGQPLNPFCTITEAVISVAPLGRATIIVEGSGPTYNESVDTGGNMGRTIAFLGKNSPSIQTGDDSAAIELGQESRVFVSDFRLSSGTGSAIVCGEGSQLWLDESEFFANLSAVVSDDCDVNIDRAEIVTSTDVAIVLTDASHMRMTSSMVFKNGEPGGGGAALMSTNSTFEILYSTIAANLGAAIRCAGGTAGPVRNSIVLGSAPNILDCPWADIANSVHDHGFFAGDGNVVVETFDESWFQSIEMSDGHVRGPATSPFNGVAVWAPGDPIYDFDGQRREATPGVISFAGADEP